MKDKGVRDEFLAHLLTATPWERWVGEGRIEPDTAAVLGGAAALLGEVEALQVLVDEIEAWEAVWLPRRVSNGGLFACVGNTGKNLMYFAAMGGDPRAVALLGERRGAGLHGVNHQSADNDTTALKYAAIHGLVPVLAALLQIPHVDPNIRDHQNKTTAFALAAEAGQVETLALLMDHPGVDMGPFAGDIRHVPLGLAVSGAASFHSPEEGGDEDQGGRDSAAVVQLLLATGKYDPNAIYSYSARASTSLLAFAVSHAPVPILRVLLAHPGLSLESYNDDPYWAPLAIALRKNKVQAADLLSAAGAPPPDPKDLVVRTKKKPPKFNLSDFRW